MSRRFRASRVVALLSPLVLAPLVAGCATTPAGHAASGVASPAGGERPPARATVEADRALAEFFARHDAATLARSPMAKGYRGIRDADMARWDDPSDAAADRALAEDRAFLAEMRQRFAAAPLSADSRLSYRLFEAMVERQEAAHAFRDLDLVFDQMRGPHTGLPAYLINIHRIDNEEHALAYIARLNALGPLLDEMTALAERRARAGAGAPDFVYPLVRDAALQVVRGAPFDNSGADTALRADFRAKLERLELAPERRAELLALADRALVDSVGPAYRRLAQAMDAQARFARPTAGVSGLARGREWYAERLAYHTTTRLSAAEVHRLGLERVAAIQAEMRALMPRLGVDGDLPQLFETIRTRDDLFYPDTPEGREAYLAHVREVLAAMEAQLPRAFRRLPRSPFEVRAVEPFREATAGKAFYQSPAPDGSRPGVYYANLYNMREMPRYEVEALAFHEAVPGHHLQRALQVEQADLPAFRRFGGYTAYIEGWALYAERLAKELGGYQDPWQELGRLKLSLWRAVRLVVDTGLHDLGWSRQQAIDYHLANTPAEESEIARAVERYAVMPGQATAYTIGELEMLRLRAEAEARPGFDLADWHDRVLAAGPVPLTLLGEIMAPGVGSVQSRTVSQR